jgi:predicted ATPase
VGEAGIGKSRLCYEFSERCRKGGIDVWAAQCTARGARQPLLLLRELARSVFGVTDWDTERAVRDKVAGRALLLDPPLEGDLPLVLGLLGIPGDGFSARLGRARGRLFATLGLLLGGPSSGPSVVVIEELRWIDPPSEAFVKALVEALPATPTLLVASFRPEYRAAWLNKPCYRRLPLEPLDRGSLAALFRDQLGTDPSLAPLAERIAERAGAIHCLSRSWSATWPRAAPSRGRGAPSGPPLRSTRQRSRPRSSRCWRHVSTGSPSATRRSSKPRP